VQGVFETRGSETEYSELGQMKQQNLDVWQDGNPYTLHHKVFIIDDKTVVLGSYNFSDNANEANDENLLVVHNAEIAAQYLAEFQRVYQQAQNPPN
jgi:phosphatidylserine/phosphatidylglycerophosphate/cardiolipin synthase-like enzyme